MTVIIALGGNVLIKRGETQSYSVLLRNIKRTCEHLLLIIKNNKTVITFGNGPEIGYLALQNEIAGTKFPKMPLDVLGAESQALIGYLLEEQLINFLRRNMVNKPIATLVTQVLVDKNDRAFRNPTKPIGPFYGKSEAKKLLKKGYRIIHDANRGYRRVVASPKPLLVMEAGIVKNLLDQNIIVIACGGGGIPVTYRGGTLYGLEAVIDKDLTSACLGRYIRADTLLILTSVPFVYLNYGKKNQRAVKKMNIYEAQGYLHEGHFGVGSMKPKVEAAIEFLLHGGKKVIITSIQYGYKAFRGQHGTLIVK